MKEKVKISDIARESGVSASAVSLALNNKPGVSDETRARVLQTARDLGYRGKSSPLSRRGRLGTVGLLVKVDPDIPPYANPFYSKVMLGIEEACRSQGIDLLFALLPVDDDNRPREVPTLAQHESVDGLLVVGACIDAGFGRRAGRPEIPLVLVDSYSDNNCFDNVISDNFQAAYQIVEYLLRLGHRKIGLLGGDPDCYPSIRDRRNGYLRAMKDNHHNPVQAGNFNINKTHGQEEAVRLMHANPDLTALFCVNDDVAAAAIRAAQNLGMRVPEDISIAGYDDTYLAANTHPTLTTMHVDTVAMGRAAVHLLALRLEHPDSERLTLTVHPRLVERQSVSEPNPKRPV